MPILTSRLCLRSCSLRVRIFLVKTFKREEKVKMAAFGISAPFDLGGHQKTPERERVGSEGLLRVMSLRKPTSVFLNFRTNVKKPRSYPYFS